MNHFFFSIVIAIYSNESIVWFEINLKYNNFSLTVSSFRTNTSREEKEYYRSFQETTFIEIEFSITKQIFNVFIPFFLEEESGEGGSISEYILHLFHTTRDLSILGSMRT